VGKTFAVGKYVNEHPGESVLYVAHLQTLCEQSADRLSLESYGDFNSGLHEHPCLSICINSIFKLEYNEALRHYDVVVIDEIEQLLSRLTGTGDDSIQYKRLVFSCLKRLISTAKKVIALDADISKITLDFLESCRPNENFNIIYNGFKNAKTLMVYENEDDVIALAKEAVANTEPSLFATNSVDKSEVIAKLIDCTATRIINSKTSGRAENRQFMSNVDEHCKADMLTVISPSVSTGFSIEGGHYQHNFAIFSHLVNTPLDCIQQLERDRVTMVKHVYFPSQG